MIEPKKRVINASDARPRFHPFETNLLTPGCKIAEMRNARMNGDSIPRTAYKNARVAIAITTHSAILQPARPDVIQLV